MSAAIDASPTGVTQATTSGMIAAAVHGAIVGAFVRVFRAIYAAISRITHAYIIVRAVSVVRTVVRARIMELSITGLTGPT